MRFTTWHLVCPMCDWRGKSLQWDYEPFVCEKCQRPAVIDTPGGRAAAVIPDEIPGGVLVPHAICHPDGTPKRYYSRSEIDRAARAAGWVRDGETPKPKHDRWV
jgi:hypothetical protein